ncbi:myo-inositol 2-dehydrogenase-like [Rana temporaria]|uniref:myo-inositol 2-dehydrogenase-like n=1 Tax=Rana temporaria TaxID=8407 RepID=UPI001AACE6B9|nr:myo-inositol 2-dehydrogenase-like [Rana temporaria]XP_040182404.1 myo-inositol 2-dehydrogenase-like [Rana temporaria]
MGRKKKTLHDYAAEFSDLAVRRHLLERNDTGETTVVETLYCKSCEIPMRVRRDRILEHLASGRHYRNRRLIKQHWNRAPILVSTGGDQVGNIPVPLDSAWHPQPSFVLQSSSSSNSVSTTNLVPSPPPHHHPSWISGTLNPISSTTNIVSSKEDPAPSTSSSLPSSFGTSHVQNPSISYKHINQRHVISEATNSMAPGRPVGSFGSRGSGIGLAVVGVGHGSRALLRSLTEEHGCYLHYIVENQLSEVEKAFGGGLLTKTRVLPEQDVDIALGDQRVSGIVICCPPVAAARLTLEALRAGKAVLCENLLSTSTQIVEACFDEAEKRSKPLVCGFYKRFDPALKYLYKKLHESSGLGRIQRLSAVSRLYPPIPLSRLKMSGGIFYSTALHDIDIVNWLLGVSVPDTVFSLGHAFCSDLGTMKDADTVNISMKFSSGAIVSLDISQHCTKTCDQRLELYGCQGSLRLDNQNPLCIIENNSSFPTLSHSHHERYREAYKDLFQHFIRTIKGKECPAVTKEQYLCALQIAAAAEQSWRNGSAVDLRNEAVDISIIKTEVM